MIHTVYVKPEMTVAELRKLVRKKLMTGGAVIRLADELTGEDCERIYSEFSPNAEPFGLASEVLAELSKHPSLPETLRHSLVSGSPVK